MRVGFQGIVQKDMYQSYLKRMDARALLDHYGAEHCTEQPGGDGTTEIVHSCLLDRVDPHHTNGDRNPSASCNVDKKLYVCYAGGWSGDLFHPVMKMEGKELFSDALMSVGEFLTGATLDGQRAQEEVRKILVSSAPYALNLPRYDFRSIEGWIENVHPYWERRGITREAREKLYLGYDPQAHRIVFPHFVDGTLVGWQKRVIPGETVPDIPKYKNSPGFPKSETLYNLGPASAHSRVLVVESPMSVAKAVGMGLPNVVATFGAKVSTEQIDLLRNFEMVYLWFDRDAAGVAAELKVLKALYRDVTVKVIAPERGRDLGDADIAEVAYKIKNAKPAALRLGEHERWKILH